jgi:subtilisin family serine protease
MLTNRSGIIEPFRRKVIQYVAYADTIDEIDGHGTHVSGSVAGKSLGAFQEMDGMASDAKIAFFDIGLTGRDYLKIPELEVIFDSAYKAGARVHTNSWGNVGGIYGQLSMDVDKYLHQHEDFLILFAGGNEGESGLRSVIAPGNAKNCLTVGATQMRSVLQDQEIKDATSGVAFFSSIGPTSDGRIKPDVVAPGDFIQSAWSGPPSEVEKALSLSAGDKWTVEGTCAVHQMSGTSMATPVTAGTVLLVRQYFMDPKYWASLCNKVDFHMILFQILFGIILKTV